MSDLISKSRLKKELSKIPSEMGLIKKAWVMQTVSKQKTYDSNNACNCKYNSNSKNSESKQTNADRIRNMSDYDLGDLLQSVSSGAGNGNPFISLCVDDNEITMDFSDIYEWLQSEVE